MNCIFCGDFLPTNGTEHKCSMTIEVTPPVKPTLGVMPKRIHQETRFGTLGYAIMNNIDARQHVPIAWLEEYNELHWELNKNGNG